MQVALSLACMMMKQYFIHICICMQQEVAGIYICEMQLLTCNLFHCKIEISLFYSFILFHFVLVHQRRRTNEEYDDVGFSHILFKFILF
jgi:hypothetical protein